MAAVSTKTGCLICGKAGHWARDCPERKGQRPREGDGEAKNDMAEATKEQVKKKMRVKRARLNVEALTDAKGLPWVYTNLPEAFGARRGSKEGDGGERRGGEVSDLRRFLELYKVWQKRIFPAMVHEDFVDKVEKLGDGGKVQLSIKGLRREALRKDGEEEEGEEEDREEVGWIGGIGGGTGSQGARGEEEKNTLSAGARATIRGRLDDDDDDDDLIAYQAGQLGDQGFMEEQEADDNVDEDVPEDLLS